MRYSTIAFFAALTLAVPVAAEVTPKPVAPPPVVSMPAKPLPAVGPVTPARQALADRLVSITQPDDLMIQSVLNGWEVGLKQEKATYDEFNRMSPGLGTELSERGKTELVGLVRGSIGSLKADIARIYAEGATEPELTNFLAFYQSSAGQKMVRQIIMSTEDPGLDDGEVTAEELIKSNRAAAVGALKVLTTEEKLQIIRLAGSAEGRRLRVLGPKVQATSADWLNGVMKRFNERLPGIIQDLFEKHKVLTK